MIRYPIANKPRKLKGVIIGPGSGPKERIQQLQIWVTSLFRHERIEGRLDRMQETRDYAEQLINLAIRNGDRHPPTMDMADKWLLEKDLVHKLFKVYVPRYEKSTQTHTRIYNLPASYPGSGRPNAILELRGNPYPPVIPHQRDTRNLLSNVLIKAATKDIFNRRNQTQTATTDMELDKTASDSDVSVEFTEQDVKKVENVSEQGDDVEKVIGQDGQKTDDKQNER